MGRSPIGKVAMTSAERQRRYRVKHRKEKSREARIALLETRVARLEARIAELEAERTTYGKKRKRRRRG
jgi:hypothetical protein